jgi:hypothetical protein
MHFSDLDNHETFNEKTKYWKRGEIPFGNVHGANRFVPFDYGDNGITVKWFISDSEEQYRISGNRERYGIDDITYVMNNRGYRSIPFDPTSKNPKIMFLGCSHTMGIGLRYEEIWTSTTTRILAERWGRDVEQHNFGVTGDSNETFAMMAAQLLPVIKPDLLCVLFTDMTRRTYTFHFGSKMPIIPNNDYSASGQLVKMAASNTMEMWYPANDFYNFCRSFNMIDLAAKANGVAWVWNMWRPPLLTDEVMSAYVSLENRGSYRFGVGDPIPPDVARDGIHYGPEEHAGLGADMATTYVNLF